MDTMQSTYYSKPEHCGCNFIDPNANTHHRSVLAAKKKAPFVQDTPALADLEDGDWEDSQLYAAWAAKYDSEHTVKFTTWLLINTSWRSKVPTLTERPELTEVFLSPISFSYRIMPLTPRLELLVQAKRENARQSLESVALPCSQRKYTIQQWNFCCRWCRNGAFFENGRCRGDYQTPEQHRGGEEENITNNK